MVLFFQEAPVVAGRGGRKKAAAKGAVAPPVVAKKKKKNEESSDESELEEEAEEEEDSDEEKNGSDKSDSSQQKDVPKHFHVSYYHRTLPAFFYGRLFPCLYQTIKCTFQYEMSPLSLQKYIYPIFQRALFCYFYYRSEMLNKNGGKIINASCVMFICQCPYGCGKPF